MKTWKASYEVQFAVGGVSGVHAWQISLIVFSPSEGLKELQEHI